MTREEFQASHGPAWAELTRHPAFFAAMQLVSADKLAAIGRITDDEIRENGTAILADFRGHLQLENALIELAVSVGEPAFDLPPETYGADRNDDQPPAEPRETITFAPVTKPKRKKKATK